MTTAIALRLFDPLRLWWLERSPREQHMIGIMATLIGAVALWYGVIMPSRLAVDSAASRRQVAEQRSVRLEQRVSELRVNATSRPGDLRAALEQAARKAGVHPQIGTARDGYVTLDLNRASSDQVRGYLVALDQAGITLTSLRITTYPDSALRLSATVAAAA